MKIPFPSKLYFIISLSGVIASIYFIYKLNFVSQQHSESELFRLNILFAFILLICGFSILKMIQNFKPKKFYSKSELQDKITLIKKFAEEKGLGIILKTDYEIELLYKSKYLGFYNLYISVNSESFECNVFEIGGKPFDWGIRKRLLNDFGDYIVKFNCASL